jgi:maltose alpha-D-glucosyltransferase / alpha-amylase
MQWTAERHGGFSQADKIVRPVIADDEYGYQKINVAQQRRDPNSLLNWVERTIRMRQECPEIMWGEYQIVRTNCPSVLVLRYDWRDTTLVTLHNFTKQRQQVKFQLEGPHSERLVDVFQEMESQAGGGGVHSLELDEYGHRWLRVGAVDTTLQRAPF